MDFEQARGSGGFEREDGGHGELTPATAASAAGRGAIVLTADPANVVVLPRGVSLDDIRVAGRDLVIQAADGTLYVIPDGAIVVPQIVIEGVAVPPLNLAALLVGNEPQPAAGETQSSGGNFADPVGPIQDAFDLGDLLPYTELAFPPQQDEEIIPALLEEEPDVVDNVPDVVIITPDNPGGAVDATASVNEAGLPMRDGEPEGTQEPTDLETTTGAIAYTAADGLGALLINGVAIVEVGQTIEGQYGILTITSIGDGSIGYSYTLLDNTQGAQTDVFTITVIDSDGDEAAASLTVAIADDAPIPLDDIDEVRGDAGPVATGNVITGAGTLTGADGADAVGADDATLTAVSGAGGADATFDGAGLLEVQGEYGTLTIDAQGNYTYVPFDDAPREAVSDVFIYTLTDGDGSTADATLTINLGPDPIPVIGAAADLVLDEDGLQNANVDSSPLQGSPSETDGTESATDSGTVSVDYGIDLPANALGAISLVDTAALDTQLTTLDGDPVLFALEGGSLVGRAGGGEVIRISITGAAVGEDGVVTYTYSAVLSQPVQHPVHGAEDTDFLSGVTFQVTDGNGDTAQGTFDVSVLDDVPSADGFTVAQGAEGQPVAISILGHYVAGADGVDLDTGVSFSQASKGTVAYNDNGTFTYTPNGGAEGSDSFTYTITDGDGDSITRTITITLAPDTGPLANDATARLDDNGLRPGNPVGDATNGDDDQNAGEPGATPSEAVWTGSVNASAADGPVTYSWNDMPGTGSVGTENVTYTHSVSAGIDTLTATVDGGSRDGAVLFTAALNTATGAYTVTLQNPIMHPALDGQQGDNTENNVSAVLIYTAADGSVPADTDTGAITIDFDDDMPSAGDDGTYEVAEDTPLLITDAFANDAFGADGAGSIAVASQGTKGTAVYNNDGTFTYAPNGGAEGADSFTYTITDQDGDSVTATVSVIIGADAGPVARDANAYLDDDGLTGGNPVGDPTNGDDDQNAGETGSGTASEAIWTGSLGTPGGEAIAPLTYALVNPGTGIVGTETVNYTLAAGVLTATTTSGSRIGTELFTVEITDPATGAYTVTLRNPIMHPALDGQQGDNTENNVSVQIDYTVTDSDTPNDSDTGTITIDFDDDMPSVLTPEPVTLENDSGASGSAYLDLDHDVDNNCGADGGHVVFNQQTIDSLESQNLTSGLSDLSYAISGDGTMLTATKDSDGSTVFTIELQPSGSPDQYVVTMVKPLDTATEIAFTDGGYDPVGGNTVWVGFTQAAANSHDLLITPIIDGVEQGSVNTNSNTFGIGTGNSLGTGDVIRLDFVVDLTGTPTASGDYSDPAKQNHAFSGHYTANGASATLTNINGNPATTTVSITAYDDNDADNDVGDGVQDAVTGVVISYDGADSAIITANGNYTVGGHQFTVAFSGGVATVSDVVSDTTISGFTDDGYTSIEFAHAGGQTFKVGGFGTYAILQQPVDFTVPVAIGDNDGDTLMQSIDIHLVSDTVPQAADDTKLSIVQTQDMNAAFVLDFSGSINTAELHSQLTAVKDAAYELFDNTTGNVTIRLVAFSNDATSYGPFTSYEAFIAQIDALNPELGGTRPYVSTTDFTAAIDELLSVYAADPAANNQVFFLSDGNPNEQTGTGGHALADATAASWDSFVNGNDVNVTAIGIGGDINFDRLQDVDVDGSGAPIQVADFSGLVDALAGAVQPSVSDNVLLNDDFGADGGRILSLTVDGITYVWDGATTITPSSGPAVPAGATVSLPTPLGGVIDFDFATGHWTYDPPASYVGSSDEVFPYQIIDGDGDIASATLTIDVTGVSADSSFAHNDRIITNQGATVVIPEAALLQNDGAGSSISGIISFSGASGVSQGGGNITFGDTGAPGGGFEYSAVNGPDTDNAYVSVDRSQAGETVLDGTSGSDTIIGRDGIADTINASSGSDVVYGLGGDDTLNGSIGKDMLFGGDGNDTLDGGSSDDMLDGGTGNDTLDGGTGADVMTGGAGADTFAISNGDSLAIIGGSGNDGTISGHDRITDFDTASDILSLFGVPHSAANTGAANGADSTLTIDGNTIRSHAISNGIITFDDADTYSSALSLSTDAHVAAVVQYLQANDLGSSGSTVAFVVGSRTFIYDQVGETPNPANDILVELQGVALANLSSLIATNHVTPVVIDLDGDGVEFSSLAAGVAYDYDGDGMLTATAWAGADDGILAFDANGDGTVSNASEFVFGGGGLTDLQGLAARFDSNGDGVLDAQDANFAQFGVWQDADLDGVADAGEFRLLADLGITEIALVSDGRTYVAGDGDVQVAGTAAIAWSDGHTAALADAAFKTGQDVRQAELATVGAVAGALLASDAAEPVPEFGPAPAQHATESSQPVLKSASLAPDIPPPAPPPENGDELPVRDSPGQPAEPQHHLSMPDDDHGSRLSGLDMTEAGSAPSESAGDGVSAPPSPAPSFFANGGMEGLMDALLLAARSAPDTDKDAQSTQDIDATKAALAEVAGEGAVDTLLDGLLGDGGAGGHAGHEGGTADASALLAQFSGGDAMLFAGLHDGAVHDDLSALAAAQA